MVTTFVGSVGSRTQDVWKFLEASQLEGDVRLAELQHSSLKKKKRGSPFMFTLLFTDL